MSQIDESAPIMVGQKCFVLPRSRTTSSRFSYTMLLSSRINRKLGITEESSDGEDYYEVTDRSSSESVIETGAGGDIVSSDNDQDLLSNNKSRSTHLKRRRGGDDSSKSQEEKLEALRRRLGEIKAKKVANRSTKKRNATQHEKLDENEEKESDAESHTALKAQTSKHACTLSRKRHRTSEIAEPRIRVKKTKTDNKKEKSNKMLHSIESRQKARVATDKQEAGVSAHKKTEKSSTQECRDLRLPKSELKKQALSDRSQNMKSKRRKKGTTKERKTMPERRKVD
jgi:ribosomal RNA-processing protein 36